jgi:hypothetical protein
MAWRLVKVQGQIYTYLLVNTSLLYVSGVMYKEGKQKHKN